MNIKFPSPPPEFNHSEEWVALSKAFECLHENMKPRWKNERKQQVWRQCLSCGASIGTAIKHATLSQSELSSLEVWDETLAKTRSELFSQAYEMRKQEKDAAWWAWYEAYLNSPAWKVKRDAALKRDHYHCQGCLEKPATQVHHLTYRHVGNELLFELTSVCNECHGAAHPYKNEFPNAE